MPLLTQFGTAQIVMVGALVGFVVGMAEESSRMPIAMAPREQLPAAD